MARREMEDTGRGVVSERTCRADRSHRSTFNNTIVTITDKHGNVISWASGGCHGVQGFPQGHALRGWAGGRGGARAAMEHGMREVEVLGKGPGCRPGGGNSVAAGRGIGSRSDQGRDADSAQRVPAAEAPRGSDREG